MSFELLSPAFGYHQPIPVRYTCDGEGISPELYWMGVPQNSVAFALIMDDPNMPTGVFTHWVLFNLPARTRRLAEGVSRTERVGDGAIQGRNDFGTIGYSGPCPPRAGPPHHYHFALYALDIPLDLGPGASRAQVLSAMQGHISGRAQLIGTYKRRTR